MFDGNKIKRLNFDLVFDYIFIFILLFIRGHQEDHLHEE